MSAADAFAFVRREIQVQSQLIFIATMQHAHRSIQEGSEITGAPGQPVESGALKASWQLIFPSATEALIATNSKYAQSNEDGIARPGGGPYRLRSSVGGRFSIQLTLDGLQRIIDLETRRLA
jgi:hypothetical protein